MNMTGTGEAINKTAARRLGIGGNIMNLISELILGLDYDENKKRYKTEVNNRIDDYGYGLYQLLEYDFKYLKNDDFGFRGNSLKTIKR